VTGPRALAIAGLLAGVACAAGCGGATSAARPATTAPATAPKTGCGSFPLPAVDDPDGVVRALPARYARPYAGYRSTVRRSAWADWKPNHGPPYTVAIVWNALGTNFQVDITNEMRAEFSAAPEVGKVIFRTTGDVDVPHELALFDAVVRQRPDLVVLEPVVPQAFVGPVERAAKAGIPTIVVDDHMASPHAVNVSPNNYQSTGLSAARMLSILGGRGNVLLVHAIPGTGIDNESIAAFKAAIKRCPGVQVAGEAYGNFVPSQAKSDTLRFLATHPARVDGVLQTAVMAPSIMQAFQQVGRPMPVVDDIGPMKGSLGWWYHHRGAYHGVGTAIGAASLGRTTVSVALRMLEGQGIRLTDVVNTLPVLTEANVGQWWDPSFTLATPGSPPGPPDSFADDRYLDPLFRHGAAPQR
jgi:ribose transport system substrate-binding protein